MDQLMNLVNGKYNFDIYQHHLRGANMTLSGGSWVPLTIHLAPLRCSRNNIIYAYYEILGGGVGIEMLQSQTMIFPQ